MFRRDASTKFGPEYAAAYFPSATIGWVISKENFMKNTEKIDQLKSELSYGFLGSDKIPSYGYISQLNGEGMYVLDGQHCTWKQLLENYQIPESNGNNQNNLMLVSIYHFLEIVLILQLTILVKQQKIF